jgi:excisionase family DNA binding protein|tara:strand:- start:1317 stop:2207 length:891 start_codon:yes stop_codon:yes gene_type:complete
MRYLNSNDVAEILGVNISTLKRWTENGTINCIKTAGGHRKFTMKHVREYYKTNSKSDKSLGLGLEKNQHKEIFDLINNYKYKDLAQILADSSVESDDLSLNTIVNGLYMKGIPVETICDEVVEPGSIIVENALRSDYLSHLEAFISRKMISRSVESLNINKPNGTSNGRSALCVNFEDNLPDLGVIMSEAVLRHSGFNVFNTGSHAELGNFKKVVEKKSVSLILFYLCDMQCCMATVDDNMEKTEAQVSEAIKIANELDVQVLFGGSGLKLMPTVLPKIDKSFRTFADLRSVVSNL